MLRQFFTLGFAVAIVTSAAAAHAAVDFATQIQPIFEARCIGCHGPDEPASRLRLDSADQIAQFRKDTLLVAGKPDESELLRRIILPADNKKRMPKDDDPLSAEEIELIRQWITEGATLTAVVAPPADAQEEPAEPAEPAEPTPPPEEDPELAKLPPASAEAIAKIEAAGGTVMPVFADSPLLQVSFAQAASPPGDEAVAALADAADQIVWLNLGKAQVTPAGLAPLANLKNLIQVHLEQSNVDDAGLEHLAGLGRLEYLNVYGTAVTDASVETFKSLAKLRRLYVWQTKISYDAAQALQEAIPGLEVNLGWDHPQVMKIRVTKELETAKEIAATAASRAAELEQQLNAAKQAKDQAEARLKELEAQLAALDLPPAEEKSEEPAEDDEAEEKDDQPAEDKPDEEAEPAEEDEQDEPAEDKPAEEAEPAEEAAEDDQPAEEEPSDEEPAADTAAKPEAEAA
jgi:mono/diheme cytochrome c family protein